MRYFVTGATGFIGGAVAQQLRAAGHDVVAVVRTPSKSAGLAAHGVAIVPGDVTDKESMRPHMTGADGVLHIAGWYKIGETDDREATAINVRGTRNVLELMRELAIPRGVYTSTLAVNSDTQGRLADETYRFSGRHISIYDRTKSEAHAIAEEFVREGLPLMIAMPGLVYGPGDTSSVRGMFTQYLQRKLAMVPRRTAYCWGHIDDTARGHVLAMERGRPGERYMICGPAHTLVEALGMAQEITGVPAPASAPPQLLRAMSLVMKAVERVVKVPRTYTSENLRVIAGATYLGDSAKARRELGFAPRPLAEGLRQTLEHEMRLLGMTRA